MSATKSEFPSPSLSSGHDTRAISTRDARVAKFLSKPLLVEEHSAPRTVSCLPWLISAFVVGCVSLAGFTQVSETAVVQGQVVPAGSVHVVQHLEGGIVAEIMVEDGEVVSAGQALLRLDVRAAESERNETRALEASLILQAERLRAFILDRDPDFTLDNAYPELVADQQDILRMQRQARDSQQEILQSRIRQRQAQLASLENQRKQQEEQVTITDELVEMRSKLVAKGLVSRVVFLETLQGHSSTRGDLVAILGQMTKTQEDLAEAEDNLMELGTRLRTEAQTELGNVSAELARVRETTSELDDRVDRLVIRAPIRGIVKGLAKETVGVVVRPGELVMEIVPVDDALVAEVQISPRDIGHIEIGQEARVEFTTYDASALGTVKGHLDRISASTFIDDRGSVFYKGTIAFDKAYVGGDPARHHFLPGMQVEGDIVTGQRTLLRYLLKPIYRALDSAFHER